MNDGFYWLWYSMLNAGFHLSPLGDSDLGCVWDDVGTFHAAFPLPIGETLTYTKFIEAVREGRTVIRQNIRAMFRDIDPSPDYLDIRVNGVGLGGELILPNEDTTVNVQVDASSVVSGHRVELILDGNVIDSQALTSSLQTYQWSVPLNRSGWIAAKTAFAHTAATFVLLGGCPIRNDPIAARNWKGYLDVYYQAGVSNGEFGTSAAEVRQKVDEAQLVWERIAQEGEGSVAMDCNAATEINYFAHFGNGQGFTSDIVLTNPSATETASGKVDFSGDNGLALRVGTVLVTSSVDFSIPPLGAVTISTDGQGGLVPGSAVVTSTSTLGGVIRFDIPGIGIAGVGTSQPLSAFVMPVRRKLEGINTGVAIHNTESQAVTLTLTLRTKLGEEVANGTRTIENFPAAGHLAQFINELFPNAATDDFEGTLVVQVTGGNVAATALELGPEEGQFTTLPVTATGGVISGTQKTYFAHFGNGGGFTSDIVVINPLGEETTSGQVDFFDNEGQPLQVGVASENGQAPLVEGILPSQVSSVPLSVLPFGAVTISTDGQGEKASDGSAVVTSDSTVGGVVRFQIPGIGIAGVGASEPLGGFIVPVRRVSGGINTGIAVHNVESQSVTLNLTLRNVQGEEVPDGSSIIENLLAAGHVAQFMDELFPDADTDDFEGTLVVQVTGGKVAATALELGSQPGQFTTLPVTPLQ